MDSKEKTQTQTLFSDSIDDTFLELLKKKERPPTKNKVFSDYFYICSTSNSNNYFCYLWELHDHYIFCRKGPDSAEIAFMDIENSFMKMTSDTQIKGEDYFGIKFSKKKTFEAIFNKDKAVVTKWFNYLKRYCILTKFKHDYETMSVLGKGNFAKVYCVRNKETNREYAVKAFSKTSVMPDSVEIKCLQYEIKMMKAMSHDRIVRLHELYEGENYIYCVLEYYRGSDLFKSIIKKGPQPEAKALAIIQQILEALAYMHELGIMHRDLKPENIMFKNTEDTIDIGIVDLGFATLLADYKKLFVRCGTPGYVAPEILNDKEYDCRVDIYSAGIIFYIILTGVIPFNGSSYDEIVRKNMKADIKFDFSKKNINIKKESSLTSARVAAKDA